MGAVAVKRVEWVVMKGWDHACDLCGWAGQEVRAVVVEGEVVAKTCVDDGECDEGERMAEYMREREGEWAAQGRAEALLGWE